MLLNFIIYVFIFINEYSSGCSLNEIIAKQPDTCTTTDISVFKPVEPSKNNWKTWLGIASQIYISSAGAITDSVFGSLIVKGMVDIQSTFSSSSSGQQQLDVAFQNAINEEFNKLRACMDEKIEINNAEEAGKKLTELTRQYTCDLPTDSPFDTEFRRIVDNVRTLIGTNFYDDLNTSPTLLHFSSYIPLYKSVLIAYDEILMSYLAFTYKVCNDKTWKTSADRDSYCASYKAVRQYAIEDTRKLSQWITIARDKLITSYTPTITKSNYDTSCSYGTTVITSYTTLDTYITSFKWGKNDIMTGSTTIKSDTFDTKVTVSTPISTIICSASASVTCPTHNSPKCLYYDAWNYHRHCETVSDSCCTSIANLGHATFNEIITEINEWSTQFGIDNIQPLSNLHTKLQNMPYQTLLAHTGYSYNGDYELQSVTFNNRNVYKHTVYDVYFYYSNVQGWIQTYPPMSDGAGWFYKCATNTEYECDFFDVCITWDSTKEYYIGTQGRTYNDRPIYKHSTAEKYVYYFENTPPKRWVVYSTPNPSPFTNYWTQYPFTNCKTNSIGSCDQVKYCNGVADKSHFK